MTRTTKTAAAPAPRNGRSGKVRTVKVNPETLAGADLSAPELPAAIAANVLGADMLAMLAEAETEEASARQRQQRAPIQRVTVDASQSAALAAAGWLAPRIDANLQANPQPRQRQNACKGGAAYRVAATLLQAGPMHVADLAALWLAAGNQPRPLNGILQQLANRTGRQVIQDGALIRF